MKKYLDGRKKPNLYHGRRVNILPNNGWLEPGLGYLAYRQTGNSYSKPSDSIWNRLESKDKRAWSVASIADIDRKDSAYWIAKEYIKFL